MIQEWIRHSVELKPRSGVAVLVDGENISQDLAGQIINRASALGSLVVKRVYGNASKMPKWEAAPGFRLSHSGSGKNATDLLLAIEAVSLFHEGSIDTVVIASSDRDFSHLAHHLRERQITVVGMGEAKAPEAFRKACSKFVELAPRLAEATINLLTSREPTLDDRLAQLIRGEGGPNGFPVSGLGGRMHSRFKIKISALPEKTWRKYLTDRPGLYQCDPKGPEAHVRLVKP